jgi:hypothetical protein
MYTKLFEFKKWLNMEPKTDKERRSCDDIVFLSEIITNSIYWQEIVRRTPVNFGANFEHIINFTEVQRISIYTNFEKMNCPSSLLTVPHLDNKYIPPNIKTAINHNVK